MTTSSATRRRRPRRIISKTATYVFLAIGSITFLIPFFWMISTSLKSEDEIFSFPIQWLPEVFRWDNYVRLFEVAPFWTYIGNTVFITVVGVFGNLVGSSIAAYAFARLRFPGRDALFFVMISTMMVPVWVTIIPSFIIFGRLGWLDTYLPILLPAFFAVPFSTFLLRQFFLSIPPEIEEAARIDGASTFRIFLTIVLPMSRPALIMVALFSFLAYWEEFLGPLIYLNDQDLFPLSLGIRNFLGVQHSDFALTMAAAAIAMAPCVILFLVAQRWFVQGIVVSGVKG